MATATFKVWRGDKDGGDLQTYEVELEPGRDKLYAAFYDRKERVIAPYYVYVSRNDSIHDK